MKVVPALDLLDGQVVRLFKGNYQEVSQYSDDPLQVIYTFKDLGFEFFHIIDLSGAKTGEPINLPIIEKILNQGFQLQVGGGIRSKETIQKYLSLGVQRVILGTKAIQDPTFWQEMANHFGLDKLVLSLDVKDHFVATHGWLNTSKQTIFDVLHSLNYNLKHLIVTDIARDGTLTGINKDLYSNLKSKLPNINIIPAGGFATFADFELLESLGYYEAIAGKAMFENPHEIKRIISKETHVH